MSYLQAILLGLVQGLTEFLPISSTAHLRVIPALAGWPDPGAAFTAVTQLGTLAATLLYFRADLARLARGTLEGLRERRPLEHPESRLALGIVAGTLPIGLCGIAFKAAIKTHLRSLYVVAGALIVLALLLLVAERVATHRRNLSQMTFRDAVLVGCAQALALVPGASRSGTTLTGGLFLGLERATAARFSFLLSIPAVAAAGLFEMKDLVKDHGLSGEAMGPVLVATVVAFFSGLAAISMLLRFLQTNSTMAFIAYRVVLGLALLGLLSRGLLQG
jgi:undecaprenyl-diphosphatase